MAKLEDRPVDSGVATLKAKDDAALVDWWKQRVALIAGIPTDVARAGALLPQLRELSRLSDADRRRVTKARMTAVVAAPSDQRQKVFAALGLAMAIDPPLVKGDQEVVNALVPEVPGASDIAREMERR